jgi:hypothetical protein
VAGVETDLSLECEMDVVMAGTGQAETCGMNFVDVAEYLPMYFC